MSTNDDLQQAQNCAIKYSKTMQKTPTSLEGTWRRHSQLVSVKFNDIAAALPEGYELQTDQLALLIKQDKEWQAIPFFINYTDGFGRWRHSNTITPDTQLCFFTETIDSSMNQTPGIDADGFIEIELWDSQNRAMQQSYYLSYGTNKRATPGTQEELLTFKEDATGIAVFDNGKRVLHFDKNSGWQLDFVSRIEQENMVPEGQHWRWATTESTAELMSCKNDDITFKPIVNQGAVLVADVSGKTLAGTFSSCLRIFNQSGKLVLEFSDYRTSRTRPELPEDQHPRSYAGQQASPYPEIHYLAFLISGDKQDAKVYDHLYKFHEVDTDKPLSNIYVDELKQKGYNWACLSTTQGTVGIAAHGRTHHPDHPFKAGQAKDMTLLGLEPFGSVVDDHYQSCDRYMLIIGETPADIENTFATLDTYPILSRLPIKRQLNFMDSYKMLAKWFNLTDQHLMRPGCYRNALLTTQEAKDDVDTCMIPLAEYIELYKKTGDPDLLKKAESAADHIAEWILAGKFHTRGEGVNPNGGGIYQSEQIYLLNSLGQTAAITKNEKLLRAIRIGIDWMIDHRGGLNTWGWDHYLWHAGGYDKYGKALYYWPVNTNEFATINLRLYQLLGDDYYYEKFKEIAQDYLDHITPGSTEIIKGGGVSDTTRGIHLLTEIIEASERDPNLDKEFWTDALEKTVDRFWIEGWIQIRNSIYAEVIHSGDTPGELFSPGFHHWHNVGSYLDIAPRIQITAEAGVSEILSRWAIRDFALDFDSRFGLEEHTHFSRFSIRDTDTEPASWLDPELLPTIAAAYKRGWIESKDLEILLYKIHTMVQHTFIELDDKRGGWPACLDAHDGKPLKYLAYWEKRHSHERFAENEPLEIWGIAAREAFHDHSTRYWSHLEQLVDNLATVETTAVENNTQYISVSYKGLSSQLPGIKAAFVPKREKATAIELRDQTSAIIHETHSITVAGKDYWLVAIEN